MLIDSTVLSAPVFPDIAKYCQILPDIARYYQILLVIAEIADIAAFCQIVQI